MKKIILFVFCFVFLKISIGQNLPDLKCVSRFSVTGSDVITWLRDYNTCYPFAIYMSNNSTGPFFPIDTIDIPDTLLTSVNILNPTSVVRWFYLACLSNPSITTDTIDNQEPEPPIIKYVSVNGNAVEIYWTPSISPETYYYQIFAITSVTRDTVHGRYTNFFFYTLANPMGKAEEFGVDARDSCEINGLSSTIKHSTIYLTASIDSCAQTALLNWTPYIGWSGTVNYEVFASFNGAAPISVSPTIPNNTTFLYENLKDKDSVCFVVHATSQSGFVSFSNAFCKKIDVAKSPNYVYVQNVSVINDYNIQVDWLIDSTAEINTMQVWRSNDGSNYSPIKTIIPPAQLNTVFIYNDNSAKANAIRYFYKISGNNCKGQTMSGNFGRNILLTGLPKNSFINLLEWNKYENWTAPVSTYAIFRRTDSSPLIEIARVGSGIVSFEDNISDVESTDGFYYYRVIAENSSDAIQSFSNEIPIRQPSKIFIPNAFVPNGNVPENKIFKPVVLFPIGNTYNFIVFDRWGKKVFQSENISDGWDGFINGQPAEQGIYAFVIELTSPTGKAIKEKGTVMLVR